MADSAPNTLYFGDNLDILRRYVADESVDLIYLDPPFNSNADYNVLFAEKDGTEAHAQIQAFEDTWSWDEEAAKEYDEVLNSGHDRVARALKGLHDFLGGSDMLAYLSMMALRLIELRRVLKPSGSIYLHCDPTASHYLKIVMDAVFGPEHFKSEIIWKRTTAHSSAKRWAPIHDTIFYYGKQAPRWNEPRTAYEEAYLDKYYRFDDGDGRLYWRADITGAGTRNGATGKPWRGYDPNKIGRHWTTTPKKLDALAEADGIYFPAGGGMPMMKRYRDQLKGRAVPDLWDDVDRINPVGSERLGYPTQKPEALLERIIRASSDEGGVVLDPFCGCGTAVVTSQKLERRWIGIDVTHLAVNLIKVRLADAFGPKIAATYDVVGEPTTLEGARELAAQDKYQFQYWALGLVNARPMEQKKGADKGIDGRLYMTDQAETKSIIISVKGGHVTASQVRDLRGVIEREDAAIGVFITLENPTGPMRKEAADAGMWKTKSVSASSHPRLQILTIEELLAGKRIDMPTAQDIRSFKQAPRAKRKKKKDAELFE